MKKHNFNVEFTFSNKITSDDGWYKLSENFKKEYLTLAEAKPKINVKELVDKYRELFPKGTNNNGYPYKGDKQGCIKKMSRFLKLNPEYDEDIILKATKKYIDKKRRDNFDYMHLAHYFIEKNNVSALGSFCEQVNEGGDEGYTNIIEF